MGHVVLGALLLDRVVRAAPAPPCTEAELLILQHLILSHHGQLEFGAPIQPLSLEAEILCHADLTSARVATMEEVIGDPEHFPGEASLSDRPLWQLDRR